MRFEDVNTALSKFKHDFTGDVAAVQLAIVMALDDAIDEEKAKGFLTSAEKTLAGLLERAKQQLESVTESPVELT